MKPLLCTAFLLAIAMSATSQTKVGEDRQTNWAWNFQEYEPHTKTFRVSSAGDTVFQNVPEESRFTIVDENTIPDSYIIFFWRWSKDKDKDERQRINYEANGTSFKYFLVPKNQLDIVSTRIYRVVSPSVGALTFPFKYRPQGGRFDPTFSLGVSGGVTLNPWRFNEHTFSFLAGISASSARVDQYSTDPAANVTEPSERASVTISLNFLYQWERLQIGISGGIDNILDNNLLHWRYQGKGWLSFGVGVGLFSASEIKTPGHN